MPPPCGQICTILHGITSTDTVFSDILHLTSSSTEIRLQLSTSQKTYIPSKKAIRLKLFQHLIQIRVFYSSLSLETPYKHTVGHTAEIVSVIIGGVYGNHHALTL